MQKYENHRTYLQGIVDAMTRTESELTARLDELRDQKKMLEEAIQSLNVFEHVNSNKDNANA